jgi:hypothetical protein
LLPSLAGDGPWGRYVPTASPVSLGLPSSPRPVCLVSFRRPSPSSHPSLSPPFLPSSLQPFLHRLYYRRVTFPCSLFCLLFLFRTVLPPSLLLIQGIQRPSFLSILHHPSNPTRPPNSLANPTRFGEAYRPHLPPLQASSNSHTIQDQGSLLLRERRVLDLILKQASTTRVVIEARRGVTPTLLRTTKCDSYTDFGSCDNKSPQSCLDPD